MSGENLTPTNDAAKYRQAVEKEQMKYQYRMAGQYVEGQLRIDEAMAKAWINEEAYKRKLYLREEARERERALVEVLEMNEEGELYIQTKNTSIAARPRAVTNMKSPRMVRYRNVRYDEACCYKLLYYIGGKEEFLFLDSGKIGKVSYLMNKFTAAGIRFEVQPRKIGPLLIQLLSGLCSCCTEEVVVPDEAGWVRLDDGQLKFFSEEELTWEQIKKKSR